MDIWSETVSRELRSQGPEVGAVEVVAVRIADDRLWHGRTDLHLCLSPPRDLNNHIEHRLLVVGIEGNVVEGRAWLPVLLDVDAVLRRMSSANFPD